jgi:hypothetical protein
VRPGTLHGVVCVRATECSPAVALDGWGVERQHCKAEAVAEGALYFPVLERQGVQERESVQQESIYRYALFWYDAVHSQIGEIRGMMRYRKYSSKLYMLQKTTETLLYHHV